MIVADRGLRAPLRPPDEPDPLPAALAVALHLAVVLLIVAATGAPSATRFVATEVELVPAPAQESLPLVTEGSENAPGASLPAPELPELASGGPDEPPRLASAPEATPVPGPPRVADMAPAPAPVEAPPPLPRAKPVPPLAVATAEPPPRPEATPPEAAPAPAGIAGPEMRGGGEFGSPDRSGHRYLGLVRAEIERARIYPQSTPEGRREGTAIFVLVVDRTGELLVLQLAKSSGTPALDDTGAEMIRRAAPLPPVPPDIPGEALELEVALALAQR